MATPTLSFISLNFHACRYDSKKTVLLVDLKRDFRVLGLGEYDEEIEENLVLLCMKARKWVWHPDKGDQLLDLGPEVLLSVLMSSLKRYLSPNKLTRGHLKLIGYGTPVSL